MKYSNNNGGGTRVAANAMARFVLTKLWNRSTFAAGGGAGAGHLLWPFQKWHHKLPLLTGTCISARMCNSRGSTLHLACADAVSAVSHLAEKDRTWPCSLTSIVM